MTTFTLTGTFTHQNGTTPISKSPIHVHADPFPLGSTVQTDRVEKVTDANGTVTFTLTTGVTGLYYVVRSTAKRPLFKPIRFLAPTAGTVLNINSLIFYNPGDPPLEQEMITLRDAAVAAAASSRLGSWTASTAYATGQVVNAPDGTIIVRNSTGTSRATFDSTEQALWTVQAVKSGTLMQKSVISVTEHPPTPQRYGAAGNGIADDTTAVQAWLTAGGGYNPPGTYVITSTVTIPSNNAAPNAASIASHPEAVWKAGAAMAAAPMVDTPVGTTTRHAVYQLPVLDCNNLADYGFWARRYWGLKTPALRVLNAASVGVVLGDPGAGTSSSGDFDVHVDRTFGAATPAGSIGVWIRGFAGDSALWAPAGINGFTTGVKIETGSGDWKLWNVHPWSYDNGLVTGFDDASDGTQYFGCIADTPSSIGFRARGSHAKYHGCRAMLNTSATDNVATGWYFDIALNDSYMSGCDVQGADGTHRFAKDLDGVAGAIDNGLTNDGFTSLNVVTQALLTRRRTSRWRQVLTDASAWHIRNAANTVLASFNTAAGSERLELPSKAGIRGYSDAFTTLRWSIESAFGQVRPGRVTTAGRPTGTDIVTGGIIFDTSIQRYIYHDGTNWKDFAGTTV